MSGARALWHSDRLDDAERVAAEGVQRFPSDLLALMEHGWVATARHDWAAAEDLLRQAVEARRKTTPNAWERYYAESLLGETLTGSGKTGEA